MEAIVFTLIFVLPLVVNVGLHVRAGLAEDADWSRQVVLVGHGMRLGLPAREPASVVPFALVASAPRPDDGQGRVRQDGVRGPAVLAAGVSGAHVG